MPAKKKPRLTTTRQRSARPSAIVWTGSADLRPLLVPIDSLKPDPRNARVHPPEQMDRLVAMLKRFGQQKPIVVNDKGLIGAGNGTHAALKQLGCTHIARTVSQLSPTEFKAFGLADNISSDLADWDREILDETVAELEEDDFDLAAAGLDLTEDELADIGAEADEAIRQAEETPVNSGAQPSATVDEPVDPPEKAHGKPSVGPQKTQWKILIDCETEERQAELLSAIDAKDGKSLARLLDPEKIKALNG
jgi:ParB-like chromosome segregation protein Spo0J